LAVEGRLSNSPRTADPLSEGAVKENWSASCCPWAISVLSVFARAKAGRERGLPEAGGGLRPSSFIHIGVVDSRIAAPFGTRAMTGFERTAWKDEGRGFSEICPSFSPGRPPVAPSKTSQSNWSFFRLRLVRDRRKTAIVRQCQLPAPIL
jgi:hypothetical protein